MRLNVPNEYLVFGDQIGLTWHNVERHVGIVVDLIVQADRLDPLLVSVCTLKGAVHYGALLYTAVAVFLASDKASYVSGAVIPMDGAANPII